MTQIITKQFKWSIRNFLNQIYNNTFSKVSRNFRYNID